MFRISFLRWKLNIAKANTFTTRNASAVFIPYEKDCAAQPEYPEILDMSEIEVERRKKLEYFEKIKNLETVEEKLYAMNLPRFYGWPSFVIKEWDVPYNYLRFVQHITRTVFYETDQLPIPVSNKNSSELLHRIKTNLEKVFLHENTHPLRHDVTLNPEDRTDVEICNSNSNYVINQINRVFMNCLASDYPHLLYSQVDFRPRRETFWRVGGFYPTEEDKKLREQKKISEERIDEPIERCFQYFGTPALQIRHRLPLLPLETKILNTASSSDEETAIESATRSVEYPIQSYKYDPKLYLNIPRKRVRAVSTPGIWPNDPCQFGLLSYHCRGHMLDRPASFGDDDAREALHSQAVLASYAWVLAQACYHGFTTFYDITYPFSTQTIITDGKLFNFYVYQLNTSVLHSDYAEESNPLKNVCHGTVTQELYHEIRDNKIAGWNDEALNNLLLFYTNVPSNRPDVNMTPYLSKRRVISNTDDEERAEWMIGRLRAIYSRKKTHILPPEIYDWEKIYKIEFQKRPQDARKRFFEQGLDPINDRRLNECIPPRISRRFRPPGKETITHKQTFYPDCYPDYVEVV